MVVLLPARHAVRREKGLSVPLVQPVLMGKNVQLKN
jgi:hypothetical protein